MSVSSYSLSSYSEMMDDRGRMDAYVGALRTAVQPGSVVIDLGAGPGFFALLACQFGAKKVYAIDPSESIWLGRELAAKNGFSDRTEFFQALSTHIDFPETADAIISDLRGVLPLFENHIPTIIDARNRLLSPSGTLIPACDRLWVAIVEAPVEFLRCTKVNNAHGLDLTAIDIRLSNTWTKQRVKPEQIISTAQCWAELDYRTITSPNVSAEVRLQTLRKGMGHGLLAWFDAELAPGIEFSNHPRCPALIYGTAFFPWPAPVALTPDEEVIVHLDSRLIGSDYFWSWTTRFPGQADKQFHQSSFHGQAFSPAALKKQAASHVPVLNTNGQIDSAVLNLMQTGASVGAIADAVFERFPKQFANRQEALQRAGELSRKYSE